MKEKLLGQLLAAAFATAAAAPALVQAASSDANLRGRAPANGLVTARNVDTGATRETRANGAGSYALVGLPPGTWVVDAGPGTAQTVTLSVASTATVNLVPTAAAQGAAPPTVRNLYPGRLGGQ